MAQHHDDLDFLGVRAIRNVLIDPVESDPVDPRPGAVWFNTTESKLKAFDGTQVIDLMAAATGDMSAAVYDPQGITADAFDLSNHTGNLDAGIFL